MAIALPCGTVIAALLGLLAAMLRIGESNPLVIGVVFAVCFIFPATLLVYILVVDRSTMKGAAERPEESVEFGWYDKAAAGALGDIVVVAGITALVLSFIPDKFALDPGLLLAGVVCLAFVSVGVRYLIQRHRS
ncbi:hypothetical protein E8P82_14630 [Arthrobacter echini]|uniref:Uncharacterized protein n=1 Tax=Arthrobacter echini TaxID=1529066 RepID=A0A4S5DZY9_9MICC|nr:hypothetical protein [Arthrobacter echini]THJ64605.1 hypothetical protein E8P82_14630 [Arthrobacter echini]